MGSRRRPRSVLVNIAAGSCGGVASTLVCHPLDTLRTRLQADLYQGTRGAQSSFRFRGALHCLRDTVRTDGAAALYRGLAWPLAAQAVYKAVIFGTYARTHRELLRPLHRGRHA